MSGSNFNARENIDIATKIEENIKIEQSDVKNNYKETASLLFNEDETIGIDEFYKINHNLFVSEEEILNAAIDDLLEKTKVPSFRCAEVRQAIEEVVTRAKRGEPLFPTLPNHSPMLPPRRGPDGKLILPELPPGLAWPTETYSGSSEAKRGGGGIVAFLERVWRPLLDAGHRDGRIYASRRVLEEHDQSAIKAIKNLRSSSGSLPSHLHFPTLKEENDLAAGQPLVRDARRVLLAASRRTRPRP